MEKGQTDSKIDSGTQSGYDLMGERLIQNIGTQKDWNPELDEHESNRVQVEMLGGCQGHQIIYIRLFPAFPARNLGSKSLQTDLALMFSVLPHGQLVQNGFVRKIVLVSIAEKHEDALVLFLDVKDDSLLASSQVLCFRPAVVSDVPSILLAEFVTKAPMVFNKPNATWLPCACTR